MVKAYIRMEWSFNRGSILIGLDYSQDHKRLEKGRIERCYMIQFMISFMESLTQPL